MKTMLGATAALPVGLHLVTFGWSQRNVEPRLRAVNGFSAAGLVRIYAINVGHVNLNGRKFADPTDAANVSHSVTEVCFVMRLED